MQGRSQPSAAVRGATRRKGSGPACVCRRRGAGGRRERRRDHDPTATRGRSSDELNERSNAEPCPTPRWNGAPMSHYDDSNTSNNGPLRFLPSPPDAATTRAILEKLKGWNSAAKWIEEGLSDEL